MMMMMRFRSKERNKGSVWEVLGGLVQEEPWPITLQNLAALLTAVFNITSPRWYACRACTLYASEHPTQRAQLMDKKRS